MCSTLRILIVFSSFHAFLLMAASNPQIGNTIVFSAEIYAIFLVVIIIEQVPGREFLIFSDSMIVLVRTEQSLARKIIHKLYDFKLLRNDMELCWVLSHV